MAPIPRFILSFQRFVLLFLSLLLLLHVRLRRPFELLVSVAFA